MKKKIVYCILLFGINILVTILCTVSVDLLFLRGAPIPLLLAAPVIIFQPWFILFFYFFSSKTLLVAVLTTFVSLLFFFPLNRLGVLTKLKEKLARFRKKRIVKIGVVFVFCLMMLGVFRFKDFPPIRRGFPQEVNYYLEEPVVKDFEKSKHYCLYSFMDSAWLWKAELSETDLNQLVEKLNIKTVSLDDVPKQFWRMQPYWWNPKKSDQVQVFSTENFSIEERGRDGLHALGLWNPKGKTVHMWFKNNF